MAKKSLKQHVNWYHGAKSTYDALAKAAAQTLEVLLRNAAIDVLHVTSRGKDVSSFKEKIRRKRYRDPEREMTDLAGIRVITYIESDAYRVAELIKSAFHIRVPDSGDKGRELEPDRFGYKSIHFVCEVGPSRGSLPEFATFQGIPFEVQIRSALQHAWAEIEHDRSYKFAGELPSTLKRRFHLVAGLLELADREFNELSDEIEQYSGDVKRRTRAGELDVELNSTSVREFLRRVREKSNLKFDDYAIDDDIIDELKVYGLHSLADLDRLFNPEFVRGEKTLEQWGPTNLGVLRDAMMFDDVDRYFEKAWKNRWQGLDEHSFDMIATKYGAAKIRALIRQNRIDLLDESDFAEEEEGWEEDEGNP